LATGEQPVPLPLIFYLRRVAGCEIAKLHSIADALSFDASLIESNAIRRSLVGHTLSPWSLDVSTINFLLRILWKLRPAAILEFGSGISTICFTRAMVELYPNASRVFVYSIEQDPAFALSTRESLQEAGLDRFAKVLYAPLREQVIEGKALLCYYLRPDVLTTLLTGVRPDFILVDGPSGKRGARFGTLPLIREYVQDQAIFFLDDGLRDEELAVAQQWTNLMYIRVTGVYLIGKGLISGRFVKDIKEAPPTH
jgi:hypothetical protein